MADLLGVLEPTPLGTILRASMAIAGHTGTLAKRMRHTAASGRCQGKTGTLTGFSNLVGYCQAADGHLLVFAFFDDGISTSLAHVIQDHMTITLANSKASARIRRTGHRDGAGRRSRPLRQERGR